MHQTEQFPADTASADALISPAFYPLQEQAPFPFPYNDALKQSLDSAVCISPQQPCDSGQAAIRLFNPVTEKSALPKPAGNQTAVILLFCLYGLLVSLNRLRSTRSSGVSGRNTSRLLPKFFVRQQETNAPLFQLSLFAAVCLGFALCLSVSSTLTDRFVPAYLSVILCVAYGLLKLVFRFLAAKLLDAELPSAEYMQKKWIAYYNMLLLFVPFVFLCFIYPFVPVLHLFCLFLTVADIYLIISTITIFSSRFRLHGIFLYFCTLEIVPVILIVVYFLRY